MTNGERIRSMSDEELAKFISNIMREIAEQVEKQTGREVKFWTDDIDDSNLKFLQDKYLPPDDE